MQLPPIDTAATNTVVAKIDRQLLQQINQFADRPLLLEKLVINQTQGLLLQLASLNKTGKKALSLTSFNPQNNRSNASPKNNLTLQLPISLAKLFNATNASFSVKLSVTSQQQIQLTIITNTAEQNIKAVPTSPLTPSVRSNQASTNQTGQKGSRGQLIVFQRGMVTADNILKLNNPINSSISAPSSALTSNLTAKNLPNSESPINNKTSQPNSLNKSASRSLNRLKGLVNNLVAAADKTLSSSPNINDNKEANIASNRIGATGDFSTVSSAANFLLKSHFSEQRPIAQNFTQIQKLASELSANSNVTSVKEIVKQINQLLNSIARPSKPSAEAIKSKVQQSGHFLENKITKSNQENNQANNLANNQKSIQGNKLNLQDKPLVNNSNTTLASKIDLKQQLLQIKLLIEQLIQTPPPPSDKSHKNSPTALNESAKNQNLAANTNTERNVAKTLSGELTSNIKASKNRLSENFLPNNVLKTSNNLLTEIKNIVSQIESNQLHSIRSEQPSIHQFLVDLPFATKSEIDSFELLFENSDVQKQQNNKKRWKVVVRFDLEPLGPMFASIELQNEKISTHIFAESKQTAQLINQNLHVLKKSLFDAGVDIDKMQGSQGKIPERLIESSDGKVDTHV